MTLGQLLPSGDQLSVIGSAYRHCRSQKIRGAAHNLLPRICAMICCHAHVDANDMLGGKLVRLDVGGNINRGAIFWWIESPTGLSQQTA